jgi:hypothetical protein
MHKVEHVLMSCMGRLMHACACAAVTPASTALEALPCLHNPTGLPQHRRMQHMVQQCRPMGFPPRRAGAARHFRLRVATLRPAPSATHPPLSPTAAPKLASTGGPSAKARPGVSAACKGLAAKGWQPAAAQVADMGRQSVICAARLGHSTLARCCPWRLLTTS